MEPLLKKTFPFINVSTVTNAININYLFNHELIYKIAFDNDTTHYAYKCWNKGLIYYDYKIVYRGILQECYDIILTNL